MRASEPLKSKRFEISSFAWSTAFFSSTLLASETMSKEGMAALAIANAELYFGHRATRGPDDADQVLLGRPHAGLAVRVAPEDADCARDRGVCARVRSAVLPHRRRGGEVLAIRRADRQRLADLQHRDAADVRRVPPSNLVHRIAGPRFAALVQARTSRRRAAPAFDGPRADPFSEGPCAWHSDVPLGRAQSEERGRVLHDGQATLPAADASSRRGMRPLVLLLAALIPAASLASVTYSFDWYCSGCAKLGMGSNGREGPYGSGSACEGARTSMAGSLASRGCGSGRCFNAQPCVSSGQPDLPPPPPAAISAPARIAPERARVPPTYDPRAERVRRADEVKPLEEAPEQISG